MLTSMQYCFGGLWDAALGCKLLHSGQEQVFASMQQLGCCSLGAA
jgi:hypothetical protein